MKTFFTPAERQIFKKLEPMTLSKWASENIIVKDGPYAGGRFRRDVNPYLSGIMDAWSDDNIEMVIVCGSAQTGKTLVMHSAIAYSVARRPGPKMLAMQDDEAINKVVVNKLLPIFRASPSISPMLAKVRANRIGFKDGSSLFLASAQASGQRASISIRDLFLDEEALYKQIAGQGEPVAEFLERTRSYSGVSKVLRVSKPIGGEECTVIRALNEEADEVMDFAMKCPACGFEQVPNEDSIVAYNGEKNPNVIRRRRLARYKCIHCGNLWTDGRRDIAVKMGRWICQKPVESPRVIAFMLPAILSQAVSLSEILSEKIKTQMDDSPSKKQQYINGYWALPALSVEMETDEEKVLALRDDALPARTLPSNTVALTAGIDTQKYGFWFTVWAWDAGMRATLIDYGRLTDWDSVRALAFETRYPYASDSPDVGKTLGIWRAGIDSGGGATDAGVISRTEEVYSFVRKSGLNRIFACKGASVASVTPVRPVHLDRMPSSKVRVAGGIWLYLLDTHFFKSLIFARMMEDSEKPILLHKDVDMSFASQMCAEVLTRDKNGKLKWLQKKKDNHYLDCSMMAFACADGAWMPSLAQILEREARVAHKPMARARLGAGAGDGDGVGDGADSGAEQTKEF